MSEINDYFEESATSSHPVDPKDSSDKNSAPSKKRPKKGSGATGFWAWFIFALILAAVSTVWIRYFNPYVTDARVTGYITSIEKRGIIFKTYEGEMMSESALADTTRIYTRNFDFSLTNQDVVEKLQQFQGTGKPVTLVYERYYGTLPWRGSQPVIVTDVLIPENEIESVELQSVADSQSNAN